MSELKNALGANSYWQVNKHLAKMLQSLNATVLLSELIDLDNFHAIKEQRLSRDGKMYFYAKSDDIEENTALSYKEQKTAIEVLQAFQLIETRIMGIPAKLYFTLNADNILHLLKANIDQRQILDLRFDTNSNTKNKRIKRKYQKKSKEVSVVTDTPPLESNLSSTEFPNNCEKEKTEKPINLENVKTETFKKEKEKSPAQKEKEAGGEKLDIDAKIAPLGMSSEKLDFIFLEASRIDTPEIRAKFIDWHVRRAKETKGVRTCLHYQKIMREIANSDLEVWEVLQGFTMAYEACWQGIKIDWIKNRTRNNKNQQQQNGITKLQQQKQYIADSPLFKGA